MYRRDLQLNALRAFEAAGRHLSFTRAAEELGVTHAAISHHVKALEDALGTALFERRHRRVVLTEAGQVLLPVMSESLDRVAETLDGLGTGPRALTVTLTPSFASRWLIPRLGRFRAMHPEIDVRLAPSLRFVDLAHEDCDMAVRCGDGNWPGHTVEPLLAIAMTPVGCASGARASYCCPATSTAALEICAATSGAKACASWWPISRNA